MYSECLPVQAESRTARRTLRSWPPRSSGDTGSRWVLSTVFPVRVCTAPCRRRGWPRPGCRCCCRTAGRRTRHTGPASSRWGRHTSIPQQNTLAGRAEPGPVHQQGGPVQLPGQVQARLRDSGGGGRLLRHHAGGHHCLHPQHRHRLQGTAHLTQPNKHTTF